jgi:lathosterol oxidase
MPDMDYAQLLWNVTITNYLRYIFLAGGAAAILWWGRRRFAARRIQPRDPKPAHVRREIRNSVLSLGIIVALIMLTEYLRLEYGWSLLYTDPGAYGYWYLPVSAVLLLLFHDAYFYWSHRLMHWRPLFTRAHLEHHRSTNPSPWAAFAFHPYEAVVQYFGINLATYLFPMHVFVVLGFLVFSTLVNVYAHLGYEFLPAGFVRHPIGRYLITATHHNQHHARFHGNYGFYFLFWDRLMGTNRTDYESAFAAAARNESSA